MNSIAKLKLTNFLRKARRFFNKGPKISAQYQQIGKHVIFGKNVRIHANKLILGDGCTIGDNVQISADTFEMGDFGTIYKDCFFPGGNVQIGHNFWLGYGSIVDGRGGTKIGNNVGIGAQSQLWTHMIYGDLLKGCRFHSERALTIGDDVWLVGHNLVSPVNIEDRSMAMLGSLITKNMLVDRTYAGTPAVDVTDKFGKQFQNIIDEQKKHQLLETYLRNFEKKFGLVDYRKYIKVYQNKEDNFDLNTNFIQLNLANQTYKKTRSILEYHLVHFLLPDLKFLPAE